MEKPDWIKDRMLAWFDDDPSKKTNSEVNDGWSENKNVVDWEEANLVTSRTMRGTHLPVIDLDFECVLKESRTPGHFHLYLNKDIKYDEYVNMLRAMVNAGVVQQGFYDATVHRLYSALRKPNE